MKTRLVIDGNAVYEIDEECLEARREGWGRKKRRLPAAESGKPEGQGQRREPQP